MLSLLGSKDEEIINETKPISSNQVGLTSSRIRRNRPRTSGDISTKAKQSRKNWKVETSQHSKIHRRVQNEQSKQTVVVDYGLKDVPIKRDPSLSKYHKFNSYNMMNAQKFAGKRVKPPRQSTQHANEKGIELQGSIDKREKIVLNTNPIGKINKSPDTRPRSGYVPRASDADTLNRATIPNNLPHANHTMHINTKGPSLRFKEGRAVTQEAEASDHETGDHEERASMLEENWAETLKSCRYLRKPRGHETPEIPIESIFQND